MNAAIGKLNIEYLKESEGVVREFSTYLASNAIRIGNRCALGFYLLEEMEQMVTEYIDIYPLEHEQVDQLYGWAQALPWTGTNYLALVFNW